MGPGRPHRDLHRDHRLAPHRNTQELTHGATTERSQLVWVTLRHDFGALRRRHRGGGFRGNRRSDPAQPAGLPELRDPGPRETTWAVPGTSTTTPAWPSTSRRPPTPTSSSRTRTGRGCSPTGAEIKQYADDVADKYDVRRHMRFNTTVEGARWDEDAKLWRVALAGRRDADRPVPDHRDRLPVPAAAARDPRHRRTSHGKVIHTADWDDNYDPAGRRIGAHRHRRHRGAADPRTGEGRQPTSPCTSAPRSGWCPRSTSRSPELVQAAVRPSPVDAAGDSSRDRRDLRVHGSTRRLHHRQLPFRGSTSPRPTSSKMLPVRARSATRSCATSSPRTTTSAASDRRSPTATTAPSPSRTCTCRTAGSTASRPTASSPRTAPRPSSTPWCWPPGSTCGRPTSRPSRSSAATGRNLGKWWRDNRIPGLPGCIDAVLPELPEPGQPVRLPRAELLQHDGIPDAAHGPVVRRAEAPRCPHLRGDRGSQHPLPGPDDRAARRFGVRRPATARRTVLLLQSAAARRRCCGRCPTRTAIDEASDSR